MSRINEEHVITDSKQYHRRIIQTVDLTERHSENVLWKIFHVDFDEALFRVHTKKQ